MSIHTVIHIYGEAWRVIGWILSIAAVIMSASYFIGYYLGKAEGANETFKKHFKP